jgi:RNA polymerase sigma factor (sigma-70 family)
MTGDWDKLRRFRQEGDEEAFADFVREYIDLVWTTAFRITGDADLARDVAQTVFADLARKTDRLPDTTILAGWLHRAASFAARRAVRDEIRRRSRERQAMELELTHRPATYELDPLLPFLDEAIAALRKKDRDAVVLRFFGKKSLAEIGAVFGVSEDAAQKRVGRALDRMRLHLRRRGVEASAALLLAALGVAGSQAAPAGIALAVTAGSISAALAGSTTLAGISITQAASAIASMKTSIMTTALVVAVVTAPIVYQEHQRSGLLAANAALAAQTVDLARWRELRAQNEARQAGQRELTRLRGDHDELARLRAEVAALRTPELSSKLQWQSRLQAAQGALTAVQARTKQVEESIDAQNLTLKRVDELKRLGFAAMVWAKDNGGELPPTLRDMTNEIGTNIDFETFVEPYEFFQHARPVTRTDPNLILFREKQPRRLPNGTWTRAYTLADGSVQQVSAANGDFSEWERQHTLPSDAPAVAPSPAP